MLVLVLMLGMTVIGCNNGSTRNLDGTWTHGTVQLMVSGDAYLMKWSGINYGKGTVSYDGNSFTFTSTHSWSAIDNDWVPFEETITGKYSVNGESLVISNVAGKYSSLNGTWTKQ